MVAAEVRKNGLKERSNLRKPKTNLLSWKVIGGREAEISLVFTHGKGGEEQQIDC